MTIATASESSTSETLPLEHVEARIVELSSQIAGATCELLLLVGHFDAANGAGAWGMGSTSAWLSWHCGLGRTAAREQVRVARALREFPSIVPPFRAGRLSYSKVRAITRVATEATIDTLIAWAQHATAAQIERIVAGQRRVVRASQARAQRAARSLSWRWDDDGSLVGSFRLPPEHGLRFLQAIELARDVLPDVPAEVADAEVQCFEECEVALRASAEAPPGTECLHAEAAATVQRREQRASSDALLELIERGIAAIEQSSDPDDDGTGLPGLGAERFSLVLNASAEAPHDLIEAGSGMRLPEPVGLRLTCDCPYAVQTNGPVGNPLHLGRKTRRIRGRLARAVHARDGGRCQAPGCANRTRQIHHIVHWARGGLTCIENLISLCDHHHWLVHEGGWTITGVQRLWRFHSPDGRTLHRTPSPTGPTTPLPHDPTIAADAITAPAEPLDLDATLYALNHKEALHAWRSNRASLDQQ